MKCPYCGHTEDKVVDSRSSQGQDSIRRRRECLKCKRRFTTYEHIENLPLMVAKKDGRRESFDRQKLLSGIIKACEKRKISVDQIEQMVDDIERTLQRRYDKEVSSSDIGEIVMEHLKRLDQVAYVRFASVYREFKDINQFMKELKQILAKERR
ncbi:MAG TPA: transcriptional repressor NrdR [Candidatus Omnitrophica bacterium]|nr:transcriptional repressor NrdR [Candidatus Omnitrophota bacterium]